MDSININNQMLKAMESLNAKNKKSNKMKEAFNMQTMDWMKLLVAQLKNQDMNTTMDTNEMNSQMAQYAQVQAVQNMVEMQENLFAMNTKAYAASLIGKNVTVADTKSVVHSDGKKESQLVKVTGKVTGITFFKGKPVVYVEGKPYDMKQVMIIGDISKPEEKEES